MLNSHSSPYDYQYQYKNTDHPPPPYTHKTNPFTQYNNVYSSNTLQNVLKGLYVLKGSQAMMQVGLMVCKYFQCSLFVSTTEVLILLWNWAPQDTAMFVSSSPIKSRKDWLMMSCTLLPHTLALPMTPPTARHTMAVLMAVFSRLSTLKKYI